MRNGQKLLKKPWRDSLPYLEDRERLAGILYDAAHQGFGEMDWFGLSEHYKPKWRKVADRLIAYLKPLG